MHSGADPRLESFSCIRSAFVARRSHRELREGERFTDAQYKPYTVTIGQFVLTWNDLHEKLALIFTGILSHGDREKIPKPQRPEYEFREMERLAGIWNSSAYDRPKREMLRGILVPLVTSDFIQFGNFEEDIRWILDEADKIEEIRNNAVHAPLIHNFNEFDISPIFPASAGRRKYKWSGGKITPNILMRNRRALRIAQKNPEGDILRELRWARDASAVLRDFALRIYWALLSEQAPWPRRPALPNRGRKKYANARSSARAK
jgi:hypothetical protein